MTPQTIAILLDSMTYEELEVVIEIAKRKAYWLAEDVLHRFESPAYSYWVCGFPDGPWSRYTSPEYKVWDKERSRLLERKERHCPWAAKRKLEKPKARKRWWFFRER